jgi:excinuclease ABC subunit C
VPNLCKGSILNKKIEELLKTLPDASGVYIMLDEYENILYVGKAKILKNRVRQYFHNSQKNVKTITLVSKIHSFRYIITPNEYEALILEDNLIKQHNPPYNILLKDDRTYPYLKINLKSKYPILEVSYKLKSDGAKYFGPYMLGINIREITELIHSVFPIRECRIMPHKECLNAHIDRCLAPCVGKVTPDEYHKMLQEVITFLNGNDSFVEKSLKDKMQNCVANEEFERAVIYRDKLALLEKLQRKQNIPFKQDLNIDVFSFVTNGLYSVVNCFAVRNGKYLGGTNYPYNDIDCENGLTSFIMQYYQKNPILCNEVLVNLDLEFCEELTDYLKFTSKRAIVITKPYGGIRKQLLDLATTNASEYLARQLEHFNRQEEMTLGAISQLQQKLNLPSIPKRIECYDISHISGTNKVASMVVFVNGEKAGKLYRHFKIRTVAGNDDFACMYEVLTRRMAKVGNSEDLSFNQNPDLIVIDGGKGQLSYAIKAQKDIGREFNIISLAKREEEVFLPNVKESIILDKNSVSLKLIIRIRDEAHRFAITHHRALRLKQMTKSELTKISGIGQSKADALLEKFKRVEKIETATQAELMEVKGISSALADNIIKFFKKEDKDEIQIDMQ